VDESYDTAEDLLVRNRTLLDKLSKELIEVETADKKHLMRLIDVYAVGGSLLRAARHLAQWSPRVSA
jgi:cell division protease FtsH